LKLKNLKGLHTVSEKAEINIEASKFKESGSYDNSIQSTVDKGSLVLKQSEINNH
jgi:hypothetical protein